MTTTKWSLDPTHSEVQFKVKHLMITTVTGNFKEFSVSAETQDDDFCTAKIEFSANTASISTNNDQRDGHIRGAEFFDVEKFPTISFQSTSMEKTENESHYKLHGNLTIKGVTKPAAFNVEFSGMEKDPWGNMKAGFTLDGKINRKDWDLNWNVGLESGGLLVSEEVRLLSELQMVKQAAAAV